MNKRFVMRNEPDASWTVYDLAHGHPAIADDRLLIGMPLGRASDLASFLNARNVERSGSLAA